MAEVSSSLSPSTVTRTSSPHLTPNVITRKTLAPSTGADGVPSTIFAKRTVFPEPFAVDAKHADILVQLRAGKYTDEITDTLTKVAKEIADKY